MFQGKQGCSSSMIMQPDTCINHDNKQDLSEQSVTNPTKKQSNLSAVKKVLGRDSAVPDAFLFKAGIFTEVLNEILQTALKEPSMQAIYIRHFRHLSQCIQPFKQGYSNCLVIDTMKLSLSAKQKNRLQSVKLGRICSECSLVLYITAGPTSLLDNHHRTKFDTSLHLVSC